MSADFVLHCTTMRATTLLIHRCTQLRSFMLLRKAICLIRPNWHVQGKRHQQNLAKRAAREAAEKPALPQPNRRATTRQTVKIGRPGYKVTKQYDPETMQRSLLFQVRHQLQDRLSMPQQRCLPRACTETRSLQCNPSQFAADHQCTGEAILSNAIHPSCCRSLAHRFSLCLWLRVD